MLRDNIKKFEDKGCVVLGVSMDGADSHKKFCDDQKLPFDLLADTDKKVHTAYGFKGMVRSLFLIGKDGKLVFVNRKFDLKDKSWDELWKAVEGLEK